MLLEFDVLPVELALRRRVLGVVLVKSPPWNVTENVASEKTALRILTVGSGVVSLTPERAPSVRMISELRVAET